MNTEQDKWQETSVSLDGASRAATTDNSTTSILQTAGPSVAQTKEQLDSLDVFQKLVEDQFKTSSQLSIAKALESDPVILEAATGLGIPHNQMVVNTPKGFSFIVLQNALDMFIQSHSAAIGVKFLLNNQYQYKKRGMVQDKGNNNNSTSDSTVKEEERQDQVFHERGFAAAALTGLSTSMPIAPATSALAPTPTPAPLVVPAQVPQLPTQQELQPQPQQERQQSQDSQEQTGPPAKVRYRYRCHRASTKSVHKGRVPGGKSGKTRCVKASIKCGCEATIAAVSDYFRVYGEQNQQVDSVPIYRVVYKAGHNHSLNMADP
ncbi:hypothetical protein BGW41_001797 [Actinomortierella wolfii]|nr:hypothetical protein BGW41_001797 [Actinomortierella wolfii]